MMCYYLTVHFQGQRVKISGTDYAAHISSLRINTEFISLFGIVCGPVSSVGIATGYGLDGPGIESRWHEIFRPSIPYLRPTQPPVQCVPGLSQG